MDERLSDGVKQQTTNYFRKNINKSHSKTLQDLPLYREGWNFAKFWKLKMEDLINYLKQKNPYYMEFHGHKRKYLLSILSQTSSSLFIWVLHFPWCMGEQ